jgi:WXXGXW repeat (2 copies)
MKNIKKALFMLALILTFGAVSSMAQVYVNVRPVRPVAVVRVDAPSPRHVYIDEDWRENNGSYEWHGGRWEAPPHAGYHYTAGYWDHNDHGHRWHQGRWHR